MIKKYSLGIFFTAAILLISLQYSNVLANSTGKTINSQTMWISRGLIWLSLFLVVAYSFLIEKSPFLLWKNKKYSFFDFLKKSAIVYFSALGIAILTKLILNFSIGDESATGKTPLLMELFRKDFLLLLVTCITAGVTEELLFRGYIQPRLEKIYHSSTISIIFTTILFGLLHFNHGTVSQIIVPTVIGLVFSIFYKKYSNIYLLIFVHFMFDFIILLPTYLAK